MAHMAGFDVGDVFKFSRLCYVLYRSYFSDVASAKKDWAELGREVNILGDSLNALCKNELVFPLDKDAQEESLQAARMVIGDFRETLLELETVLKNYKSLGTPNASGWKMIKWKESHTVERLKERIVIHSRAIDMMLNPIML
jgi:hypothetical protein